MDGSSDGSMDGSMDGWANEFIDMGVQGLIG